MGLQEGIYSVGVKYPKWKTGTPFVQIDYGGAALTFIYAVPNPTKEEIDMVSNDTISVAFTVLEDIPFILLNFQQLGGWMDSPFYPNPYPDDYFKETFSGTEGLALMIFTVDSATGELKNIRAIGLSNAMSNALFEKCRELKKLPTLSKEEQDKRIDAIYEKYPTSDAMMTTVKPEWVTTIVTEPI